MMAKRASILIVDDEEAVRRLLHRILSKEGYQCREAVSFKLRMIGLLVDAACLHQLDIIDY
jgi:CheY-like chemotaxis protein